jgi:hypothetical protein
LLNQCPKRQLSPIKQVHGLGTYLFDRLEKRTFTSLAPSEVAELLASVPAAKAAAQGSSLNPKGFDELKAFSGADHPPLVTVEVEDGQ